MKNHDECVKHFVEQMSLRGSKFVDFESTIKDEGVKRPDLIKNDRTLLVEIKTLQPQSKEQEEVKKLNQELLKKNIVGYSKPDFHGRFIDHLDSARRKFRDHPSIRSLVVMYDLHDFLYRQDPRILMEGVMKVGVMVPKNSSKSSSVTFVDFDEKPFRQQLNNEIGGIAFWDNTTNGFAVFVNSKCNIERKLDISIFSEDPDTVIKW